MQKNGFLRHPFSTLFLLWLAVNSFIFLQFGVVQNFEATKYIEQGQHLLQYGTYTSANFIFYSVQILLIALCLKLQISLSFIVLLQLFTNAIATFYFYRLALTLSKPLLAYLATTYLILFYYYQLYNRIHLLFYNHNLIQSPAYRKGEATIGCQKK